MQLGQRFIHDVGSTIVCRVSIIIIIVCSYVDFVLDILATVEYWEECRGYDLNISNSTDRLPCFYWQVQTAAIVVPHGLMVVVVVCVAMLATQGGNARVIICCLGLLSLLFKPLTLCCAFGVCTEDENRLNTNRQDDGSRRIFCCMKLTEVVLESSGQVK